jgi:hypothetical protein
MRNIQCNKNYGFSLTLSLFIGEEARAFHKSTMHFYCALRAAEGAQARATPGGDVDGASDLLQMTLVLTDTTTLVTKLYGGDATKEHAVEVLTALLIAFDARVMCHGPHGKYVRYFTA